MDQDKVAQENVVFFIVAVGMSLGIDYFTQAVFESSQEVTQFPTDNVGKPGYIRIDTSSIKKKDWYEFIIKVKKGLLVGVSYQFGSNMNFEGDFLEKVVVERGGYKFVFEIRQYERDMEHEFKIIDPEDLKDIPEDEKLGRVCYMEVTPL